MSRMNVYSHPMLQQTSVNLVAMLRRKIVRPGAAPAMNFPLGRVLFQIFCQFFPDSPTRRTGDLARARWSRPLPAESEDDSSFSDEDVGFSSDDDISDEELEPPLTAGEQRVRTSCFENRVYRGF